MTVLYISYNGLTEPLGRRQVLPYILGLSARGWRFIVLSFEKRETCTPEARAIVAQLLIQAGCRWIPLRYHRRPSVPATAWDVGAGILRGLRCEEHVSLVHARSLVPAAMAAALARFKTVPWIFDVRGLVAREYEDGGHWTRGSLVSRLTDAAERRLLSRADGLVFLTERIVDVLKDDGSLVAGAATTVIPCAADLLTFRPDERARLRRRSELGLGEHPVLVYAGSLGSWYSFPEMVAFYLEAREEIPDLRFMVLTPQPDIARRELRVRGLERDVLVLSVKPDDVPSLLASADAGICFVDRKPSKLASSPTKQAEYLASGLPVVTDGWTGDAQRLRGQPGWILIESFSQPEYRRAAGALRAILATPDRGRSAAVSLAEAHYSLPQAVDRYDTLYRRLLDMRGG